MKIGNLYINEDKIIAVEIKESMLKITLYRGVVYVRPEGEEKLSGVRFVFKEEFEQLKENIELKYT